MDNHNRDSSIPGVTPEFETCDDVSRSGDSSTDFDTTGYGAAFDPMAKSEPLNEEYSGQ